jgi:hypothetical protein
MNGFIAYNAYGTGFLPRSWYYQNPGPGGAPQAALVLGTDGFPDAPVDAVVGHDLGGSNRYSLYAYRIPAPGLYSITGEVWAPNNGPHGSRTHDWNLNIDDGNTGNPITTLDSGNVGGAFGHNTYASRDTFSFQQAFAGGELVVLNYRHNNADGNPFGGFVAMNLDIVPVPEPSSVALAITGVVACAGLCVSRKRRRRSRILNQVSKFFISKKKLMRVSRGHRMLIAKVRSTSSMRAARLAALLCVAICIGSPGILNAAIIHDLSAEFSTTQNPTGGPTDGWGYNAAGPGGPVGPFGSYSSGDFLGGQLGWRVPAADHIGWAKITNAGNYGAPADSHDIQNGDVITHASTSVAWQATASTAGTYFVDVSAWQIRDLDRTVDLQLWKNDATTLTGVVTLNNVGPANSSRAAPLVVANGFPVTFLPGDFIRLRVDGADYVGVNFTLTPVPEPTTCVLGLLAAVGIGPLVWLRRRNRKR